MSTRHPIQFVVNGRLRQVEAEPRQHLADCLRDTLGLTATHLGCEHGVCGACTLRLDGEIVRGCLVLAVQADGCEVTTLEGLDDSGEITDLQQAFVERNALQCGFCTPGMLICAAELLREPRPMSREAIRAHIAGNYCRCTGYEAIVDAIEHTIARRIASLGQTNREASP